MQTTGKRQVWVKGAPACLRRPKSLFHHWCFFSLFFNFSCSNNRHFCRGRLAPVDFMILMSSSRTLCSLFITDHWHFFVTSHFFQSFAYRDITAFFPIIFRMLKLILKHELLVLHLYFFYIYLHIVKISLRHSVRYPLTCQMYLSTINKSRCKINK